MTTLQILKRGLKRIEKGWCKGPPAKDKNGKLVNVDSKKAVEWCGYGAIEFDLHACIALEKVLPKGKFCIVEFSESQRTKRPIIALYKRAIAKLEKDKKSACKI